MRPTLSNRIHAGGLTLLLLVGIASACSDTSPTGVEPPDSPPLAILDGASGGNEHFFFLPPMVAAPDYHGVFDATLTPVVVIRQGSTVIGEVQAVVDTEEEHYRANWHTDEYALDPDLAYRLSVEVSGFELGFADIDMVETGAGLRHVQSGEYIGLVDGRTLPVKFRIEEGAIPTRDADWTLLTALPADVWAGESTYDRERNLLYVMRSGGGWLGVIDLDAGTLTEVPASGWIARMDEFVYDPTANRILGWRSGVDAVYQIPASGGTWSQVAPGGFDATHYGGIAYWNPAVNGVGFFAGYGYFTHHNSIFERNNVTGAWTLKRGDTNTGNPPRAGFWASMDESNSRMYLAGTVGNLTGSQYRCEYTITWVGSGYCWARGLWVLDLTDYSFETIVAVDDPSMLNAGAIAWDYHENVLYLAGGWVFPASATSTADATWTNGLYRFEPGVDDTWQEVELSSNTIPAVANYGQLHYDGGNRRLVWLRPDGIWTIRP